MAAAEHNNCDWRAVEHSIRVVLRVAWKRNPKKLEEFMGYELFCQPKTCEFLSAAVAYLQKQAAIGV